MPDCLINNDGSIRNEDSVCENEVGSKLELKSASLQKAEEITPVKMFSAPVEQNKIEHAAITKLDRVASPDEDLEEEKDIVPGYTDTTDRGFRVERVHTGSTFGPNSKRSSIISGSVMSNMDRLVQLNKQGMERLSQGQFLEAKLKLKEAEQLLNFVKISKELSEDSYNKLYILTMNNIGCYYKKVFQPNVALQYLKKALNNEI